MNNKSWSEWVLALERSTAMIHSEDPIRSILTIVLLLDRVKRIDADEMDYHMLSSALFWARHSAWTASGFAKEIVRTDWRFEGEPAYAVAAYAAAARASLVETEIVVGYGGRYVFPDLRGVPGVHVRIDQQGFVFTTPVRPKLGRRWSGMPPSRVHATRGRRRTSTARARPLA